MSELTLVQRLMALSTAVGGPDVDTCEEAATTIESLQAQLAAKPPASADTDAARKYAAMADGLAHEFGPEGYDVLMEFSRLMYQLADTVDHGRHHRRDDAADLVAILAECERLRAACRPRRVDDVDGSVSVWKCPLCHGVGEDVAPHVNHMPGCVMDDGQ